MSFRVGQKVQIADGRVGTIRFIGEVSFKDGQWMGLELEEAEGKNDGSVRGERYFECKPEHGLFIQPSGSIVVLEEPRAAPAPTPTPKSPVKKTTMATANGKVAAKPRPSSITGGAAGTPSRTATARQSIAGAGGGVGTAASKRTSIAPSAMGASSTTARRQTMAPPTSTTASRTSRQSLAPTRPGAASPKKPSAPISRQSSVGGASLASRTPGVRSPASAASPSPSIDRVLSPGSSSSGSRPAPATRPAPSPAAASSSAPSVAARSTTTTAGATAASTKAAQENEAKIRLLEKKVGELRQKVSDLQPVADKAERYDGIIQKLQSKAQSQFAEINELKKQLKESESGFAQIESIQAEHDTNMEMAALDREMAEEKAEAAKAELDSIRGRLEELQLENEILRGENEELSKDMSPEERASQGWMQMQRENARLRDALIRLRDMTQEQESALKEEIALLEEESEELDQLKGEYDATKTRLLEMEAESEDLREQLEAALGAETMIEQLTDKNLEMTGTIEELRNTVEDLESLKELNDEIELSHVEDKKMLQQEIDYKEALLIESARRVVSQDEELADRDYTIQRFRELVTNMQSDLEDMRSSKEITETQAQELGSHSRAMMDLNRQLQASASNTRVKTIEMELRRLEAQEAAEHLSIVQLFLPDAFQSERDSVLAFLRFKRISFKAQLLHGFMKERITSPGPHATGDALLAACDALDKLTWITAMCDRFTSCISTSSLPQFAKFESVLYELEPVERALNGYIENLRKDELRDQQVADGLQRAIAVMLHLSELHLHDEGAGSYADEVLMKTMLMQSNLETTAAALHIMKNGLLKAIPASEDGEDSMSAFAAKTDALGMQARSGRVIVSKILRSLQDLKARSLALTTDSAPGFEDGASTTSELASSLRELSLRLHNATHDEDRSSANPFTFTDLMSTMRTFTSTQDADVFTPLAQRMRALHERLSDLLSVSQDLSNTLEFEVPSPPWVLRSKALAESKLVSQDAQAEIGALKREIHERSTTIKMRENELEEQGVKIELLESRMKDSSRKVARIGELEKILTEAKKAERELERRLEEKNREVAKVEEEREKWARKVGEMQVLDRDGEGAKNKRAQGANLVGTSQEMEALRANIKVLESTIRYLRREVRRTQAEEAAQKNAWLRQPLTLPPSRMEIVVREKREDARRAFKAIAELPLDARPVVPAFVAERNAHAHAQAQKGGKEKEKAGGWKPRKVTTMYQLFEAESAWLDAKELMGGHTRNRGTGGNRPVIVM